MPYYQEVSRNETVAASYSGSGGPFPSATRDYSVMTGYRTQPKFPSSRVVSDQSADPYNWFLKNISRTRYKEHGAQITLSDTGHTWSFERHKVSSHPYLDYMPKTGNRVWARNCYPTVLSPVALDNRAWYHPADNTSATSLSAFGQTAIAKVAPSPSTFQASQFLGELREGLPKLAGAALLKGRVRDVMKNAGGEYLNIQFGWLPLVGELQQLCNTLLNVDALLRGKRDEQGRPRKARFATPEVVTGGTWSYAPGTVVLMIPSSYGATAISDPWLKNHALGANQVYGVTGSIPTNGISVTRSHVYKRWFEGSFTSFFDYPLDSAPYVEKALALMNMQLTPAVLWELAPWSWLVDWIFKIQSTIESNSIAGDERVVMNYGYVMEKSTWRTLVSFTVTPPTGGGVVGGTVTCLYEDQYMRRVRANPFGFQASAPGALTASQLGILAALGLSKH